MRNNPSFQYMKIHDDLMDQIQSGAIQPGDKFPTEFELMEQYNVSRITCKNALQLLKDKGYILRERGRGTFLTEKGALMAAQEKEESESAIPPRTTRNRILGIVVDELEESYGLHLFYELDQAATRAGYHLIARMSYGDQARESQEIQYLRSMGAEGIFILPARAQFCNTAIVKLLLEDYPVLIIDCMLRDLQAHAISSDNVAGSKMLTQHLIDLGHKQIGLVSVDRSLAVSLEDRYRGYRHAIEENNLTFTRENVLDNIDWPDRFRGNPEAAEAVMETLRNFLVRRPSMTAVITTQYSLASLMKHAALQLGKRVPEDLSIVTFDECYDLLGEYTFTHVKQDESTLANHAMDHMLKLLNKESAPCTEYLMPTLMQGKTSIALSETNTPSIDEQ